MADPGATTRSKSSDPGAPALVFAPTIARVSLEGWIFMVGLRVFDIGALIVWLVWFFKLRDDDSDDGDDFRRGGDAPETPTPPTPGPGLDLPLPDAKPWPTRRRDHGGDRAPATAPSRYRPAPRPRPRRQPAVR